jgi:hypothetical protein
MPVGIARQSRKEADNMVPRLIIQTANALLCPEGSRFLG